jgi:ligand-binding sensor domain-containing protein
MNFHYSSVHRTLLVIMIAVTAVGCKNPAPGDGLNGPAWMVFTTANSVLVNNDINHISSDNEGKVWFATDRGASAYSKGLWTSIRDKLTDSASEPIMVTSIFQDKASTIWFTLMGGGVERYNINGTGAVWVRYTEADGLPSNFVYGGAAYPYDPGDVFFATSSGIGRFTPSKTDPVLGVWTTFTAKEIPELGSNRVTFAVTNTVDNTIWFGTQAGTVIRTWYDYVLRWGERTPPANFYGITAIAFDRNVNVWIGTTISVWQENLRYDDWTMYDHSTTQGRLPRGPVNAVAVDWNNNRTWFGTNGGLFALRDTSWTVFRRSNSPLPSDTVKSLYIDFRGNLWCGTAGGAAEYNEQGIQQ